MTFREHHNVFLRSGSVFTPASEADLDIHPQLPVGNYIIFKDPQTQQLKLKQVDPFVPAKKLYGSIPHRASRILNTYNQRPTSTGVLLAGAKGSGKTETARSISLLGAEAGMPTITINQPWTGDEFSRLIQGIHQPAIIIFDEFEKVYDDENQEYILTLLDGVFPSKKLFILTCNDKWRIDQHMRNRPGRIYYLIDHKGVDQQFIVEYCKDVLIDQTKVDDICKFAQMFDSFNFDLLKSVVEELNRYGESLVEVISMLNANPKMSESDEVCFDVQIVNQQGDVFAGTEHITPHLLYRNPLDIGESVMFKFSKSITSPAFGNQSPHASSTLELHQMIGLVDDDQPGVSLPDELHRTISIGIKHLVNFDPVTSQYVFSSNGIKVMFRRTTKVETDVRLLF